MVARLLRGALVGVVVVLAPVGLAGAAYGHGYAQNPASRSYWCAQGEVQDCGAIQWEPQSVEGPKGFPEAGPADGSLCAGGNARFAQLDDPSKQWPTTRMQAGQPFEFVWTIKVQHSTTSFEYFITKDGWDPTAPLSRAQLEPEPFFTVPYGGEQPPKTVRHTGELPAGKSGRHLIYAVWTIADTGNAFYSCADVSFG